MANDVDALLSTADRLLSDGFHASVLRLLRTTLAICCCQGPQYETRDMLIRRAYEALGRGALARRVGLGDE